MAKISLPLLGRTYNAAVPNASVMPKKNPPRAPAAVKYFM